MILQRQDKVLIAHRRLYDRDEPRFFIGEVLAYEAGVVKVAGYSHVKDMATGVVIRKDELRIKILSLSSYSFLVYQLPAEFDVSLARFEDDDGHQTLTDGNTLRMNLAEHPHQGHL